jgi:hypothetical protein
MTITKVIKDLIETNTYNQILSNIGNTQPVTINSIVFANTTFVNTSNTSMLTTGGHFKLYGNNYQSGANVYLDKYLASNTQFISSNELRVTFSILPPKTYSLFLYNPNGSNSIRYNSFLVQGNNTLGYIAGGTGNGNPSIGTVPISSVERITFSNDTVSPDNRGNLPTARAVCYSFSTNQNGYISLGRSGTSPFSTVLSNAIKILFNNDTASATSFPFSFPSGAIGFGSSLQNSTHGYHVAGFSGGNAVSSIFRLEFANDSNTPSSRGTLETARAYMSSAFNNVYGWIIGGYQNPIFTPSTTATTVGVSLISRMDFSADTNVTIVRGPIGENYFAGSAVHNQNFTWFCGGMSTHTFTTSPGSTWTSTFYSTLNRFDFNNDTTSSTTRLPSTTGAMANILTSSVEDGEYGWFVAGTRPSLPAPAAPVALPLQNEYLDYASTSTSTVTRMTFSNDTIVASTRGALNVLRKGTTSFNGINT